tara:strand:- start:33092 stop:33574 length:483 start_codon:yes stop_codon:yes gene_type:complete
VQRKAIKNNSEFKKAQKLANEFAKLEGRQPRIMIAKLGEGGHNLDSKIIASGYADLGFDVDIGPLFQTPKETVKQAVENDVHILGISSYTVEHKTLIPQVIEELKKNNREDILVIVGGLIPAQDYKFLLDAGVAGVYEPETKIAKAAIEILNVLINSVAE